MPLAGVALTAAALAVTGCGPSSTGASGTTSSAPPASSAPSGGTGTSSTGGSGGSGSSGTGAAGSACTTSQLSVTAQDGQAAAGTFYQTLVFTNTGGASCTLSGYPGVSLADGTSPVGASATRDNGSGNGKTVTLAPGGKAYANLGIADAHNYPNAKCQPAPVGWLQVFPPNQTGSVRVSDQTLQQYPGCQSKSVSLLTIQPVTSSPAS